MRPVIRKLTRVGILVAVLGITLVFANTAINQRATAAFDAANNLPGGEATAFGWDSDCKNVLAKNAGSINFNSSPTDLRDIINGLGKGDDVGASYRGRAWLSALNKPNVDKNIDVNQGDKSVTLQLNSITFLCAPLVTPDQTNGCTNRGITNTMLQRNASWSTPGNKNFGHNPNDVGGDCQWPARLNDSRNYLSITDSSPLGNISGFSPGTQINTPRDDLNRFWVPNRTPTMQFVSTSPSGFQNDFDIVVTLNYKEIMKYQGPVYRCSGTTVTSLNDWGPCNTRSDKLNIHIHVNKNVTCTPPDPSCTPTSGPWSLTGRTTVSSPTVVAGSGSVTFTHYVKNNGTGTASGWHYIVLTSPGNYMPSPQVPLWPSSKIWPSLNGGDEVAVDSHPFSPKASDAGKQYCEYIGYDPVNSNTPPTRNGRGAVTCVTIVAPPPELDCVNILSTNPAAPDPGATLTATVGGSIIPASVAGSNVRITISGGGFSGTSTAGITGNFYMANFNGIAPPTPGTYTVNWTITTTGPIISDPASVNCSDTYSVANKPYLSVQGGDIMVGKSPASDGCYENNQAGIAGWNNGLGKNYSGAGTQYAEFAVGMIFGSASALGAAAPSGLSFANTSASPAGDNFGGGFGSYFNTPDNNCGMTGSETVTGTTVADIPSTVDGTVIVHITGNVFIDHDVKYKDASTSWAKVSDIPFFKLVVTGGNIYIGKNVQELDGVYIAESDSTGNDGGIIYTCASAVAAAYDTDQVYDNCGANKLTVYGSFIAKQIQFGRTKGTVGQATDANSSYANSAEQFIYTPEVWLPRGINQPSNGFKAIVGLPPVL